MLFRDRERVVESREIVGIDCDNRIQSDRLEHACNIAC